MMPARRQKEALLWLVVGLLWPASSTRAERQPFGMNAFIHGSNFSNYGPPAQMQADIGVQWSRVGLHWYWIQPDANLPSKAFVFTTTDPIVDSLFNRGVQIVGVLYDPPNWASSGMGQPDYFNYPPANLNDWEGYVRATVSHYESKIKVWQIWNEENNNNAWKPSANASQYVSYLDRAYQAIKGPTGEDPSATVVLGGLSGIDLNYLKAIKDGGGWNLFDVVAVHPYQRDLPPEYFGRIDNLLRLRSLVLQYGVRPIWYTEVGWPTQPYVSGVTESTQADYLVRDAVTAIALQAEKYFWYNFRNDGTNPNDVNHHHGLLRFDESTKPSYTAHDVMTTELQGATFWRRRAPYPFAQGLISGFETSEPWVASGFAGGSSSFIRTSSVRMMGSFSGQWTYSFPSTGGPLALLTRASSNLPGTPKKFRLWLLPDDGDHRLSVEFKDMGNETFRAKLGFTIGTRWQRLEANIEEAISLGGDGTINYPIRFDRFILESFQIPEFPFYGKLSGLLYLDDFQYEEGDSLIYDYQFSKKGSFVDVVWTTAGSTRLAPFPASQLTRVTLSGSVSTITDGGAGDADGNADGWTTVSVTGSPVYVRWTGMAAYVLDGYGGVHGAGQALGEGFNTPYFGFDVTADLEGLHAGDGYYLLDGFGGIHAGREAAPISFGSPYFGFHIARDLEIPPNDAGAYVLDGFGGVHASGRAPVLAPATPYFGFDVARDLELLPAASGYYVLDGFGGAHPGGSASSLSPGTPYFGFDVARDMELASAGYYVLDGFGGVHAGGGAPVLSPSTPYFGFNIARGLELASSGFYVMDGFGGVHAGGGAAALSATSPYFGFDIARDLLLL